MSELNEDDVPPVAHCVSYEELVRDRAELCKSLVAGGIERERLRSERDEAQHKLADAEDEVQRMDERLTDVREERDAAREKAQAAIVRREELRAELEALRGDLKTAREQAGEASRLTIERDKARKALAGVDLERQMTLNALNEARGEAIGLRKALRLMIAGGDR